MGLIEKFFGGKASAITSAMIRDEIVRAEGEINALRVKLGGALAGVAAMSDAEHVKVEGEIAGIERAITRLEARVAYLNAELPTVIAAEKSAAKTATDEALRQRAEMARKANEKEAAKLLADYNAHAAKIGDILARLEEMAADTNRINADLHHNPVAESVLLYDALHRKHPDQQATERREMRLVWAHGNGKVEVARLDQSGNPIKADRIWNHMKQGYEDMNLERREVVVERVSFRPGRYESPLSAIHLPAGFTGVAHWPRKS
jgi:chromosome segregation ATPase